MKLTKKEQERVRAVTRALLPYGKWETHGTWSYYMRDGIQLGHLVWDENPRTGKCRATAYSVAHGNERLHFDTVAKAMAWVESTYGGIDG